MSADLPYNLYQCPSCGYFLFQLSMTPAAPGRRLCKFHKPPRRLVEQAGPVEPCENFLLEGRR